MLHIFKKAAARYRQLHLFSRDVIHGSAQFCAVLYIFALVTHLLLPRMPDILRAVAYRDAALEIAPATFAVGVIAALVADLALRREEPNK